MIPLHGRATPIGPPWPPGPDVRRIAAVTNADVALTDAVEHTSKQPPEPTDTTLWLLHDTVPTLSTDRLGSGPRLQLPESLWHLSPNDIIAVAPDGKRISVLWKASATHNSLLLTERCDNYCIMCSQPPKERDDAWLYDRAKHVVSLIPAGPHALNLTGGEPTLAAEPLLDLLRHCRDVAPELSLHMLSNGRRFADADFSRRYADIGLADIMVGIPIYAAEAARHDYIVQAEGAFEETVRGILTLAVLGQCIELRIVVQRHTVPVLGEIAEFIARNLPFVDQVALMGLEMTGLARPNADDVWIDPVDYQDELAEAVTRLSAAGIPALIYNHQLCVLDRDLWPYAVASISDWKNDYLPACTSCAVRETCGGLFATSGARVSKHIALIPEPVTQPG